MAGLNGKKIQLLDIDARKLILLGEYLIYLNIKSIGQLVAKINQKSRILNPTYKKRFFQRKKNRPREFIYLTPVEQILGSGYVIEGPDIKRLLSL